MLLPIHTDSKQLFREIKTRSQTKQTPSRPARIFFAIFLKFYLPDVKKRNVLYYIYPKCLLKFAYDIFGYLKYVLFHNLLQ